MKTFSHPDKQHNFTKISLSNPLKSKNSKMTRKCALCATPNHNMTTCPHLAFRQEQAHRLYIHLWQKWVKCFFTPEEEEQTDDVYPYRYVSVANFYIANFLKDSTNFRLLKSYLNLAGRGTDLEIKSYIYGLYHYLVLQKVNKFEEYARHNNLGIPDHSRYDYLLASVPVMEIPVIGKRNYGITVSVTSTQAPENETQETHCPICYEDMNNVIKTNCGHSFCQSCVTQSISILPDKKTLCCAMCRTQVIHLDCCNSDANIHLKNILNL